MKEYKKENPQISHASLITDGAGCFGGTEFWLLNALTFATTKILINVHFVTECGGGKSYVDAHFCYGMKIMSNCVADGRGNCDIENAKNAADALASGSSVQNTSVLHYTLRNRPTKSPVNMYSSLSSFSQREYVYGSDNVCTYCNLFKFSEFRDKEDKRVTMEEMAKLHKESQGNQIPDVEESDIESTVVSTNDNLVKAKAAKKAPMQLNLTSKDVAGKKAETNAKSVSRMDNIVAKELVQKVTVERAKEESRLLVCKYEACNKCFKTKQRLKAHEDDPSSVHAYKHGHQSAVTHTTASELTDKDIVSLTCIDATKNAPQVCTKTTLQDPERMDTAVSAEEFVANSDDPTWAAAYVKTPVESRSFFRQGHGNRSMGPSVMKSVACLEFIIFCVQRGEKDTANLDRAVQAKTLPLVASKAMFDWGTKAGEAYFCGNEFEKEFMKASDNNSRRLPISQCLTQEQLKGEFAKSLSDLQKQLLNAQESVSEKEKNDADPLRMSIFKAQRIPLAARINKFFNKHRQDVNIPEEQSQKLLVLQNNREDKEFSLYYVREAFYNIIQSYGGVEL